MIRATFAALILASRVMSSAPAAEPDWDKKTLTTIEDTRKQELQKLSDTKGTLAGMAWGFASGSAGAAAIPGASVVTGIAADVALTVSWLALVSNRYGATEADCQKLAGRAAIDEGIKSGAQAVIKTVQSKVYDRAIDNAARQAAERALREGTERGAFEAGTDAGLHDAEQFWRRIAEEYVAAAVAGHKAAARLEAPVLDKLCRDATNKLGSEAPELNEMLKKMLLKPVAGREAVVRDLEQNGVDRILQHLEMFRPNGRSRNFRTMAHDGLTEVTAEQFNDAAGHAVQASERAILDAAENQAAHTVEEVVTREAASEVERRTAQAAAMVGREYAEKLVERYSSSEGVKEACAWIPFLGNAIGAGVALGMMRDLCGNFNNTYYDAAVANVNKTYDSKTSLVKAVAIADQEAAKQ